MKLSQELAQYIVDYTSKIIDYNINIMDPNAVIIASNDSVRIGETHMGARKVLVTGEPYTIDKEEAKKYPNVIPGISLPIHFKDSIIGVIGIGAGEQAATIGKVIQSTTELLIEQFHLKETLNAETQVRNEFLTHLLTESWFNNESYFHHQLKLHHFNLKQPYLLVTAELLNFTFENNYADNYESEIVHYEKSISTFLENIEYKLNYLHINLVYIPNAITFLIPYSSTSDGDKNIFMNKFITNLDFVLSQTLNFDYRIGIGGFAEDMTQIHYHYKCANSALKISKALQRDTKISSFTDVYFEHLLFNLSQKQRCRYWESIIGKLLREDNGKGMYLETLETFFQNDQSIAKTSAALFIHRNTLLFRLNRIGEITGFYPQHLKDAINLYTALTLYKLNQFETASSNAEIEDQKEILL